MKKYVHLMCMLLLFSIAVNAQETFPRNDVKDNREKAYAFTNATIVVDHQTTIENGTLLIRDGKIVNVGSNVNIPSGYTTIDVNGNYIYPSMIDPYTNYGLAKVERNRSGWGGREQIQSDTDGAYNANEAIKSEYNAGEHFSIDSKSAEKMREYGFGTALTFRPDGLARGTSALVTLGESSDNEEMLKTKAAAHYSFTKGTSNQMYPSSTMGYIALLRQTFLDARWYNAQNPKPFVDLSLESWLANQGMPQIFDTDGWLEILRADKLGDEFGVQYIIKGGGDEYQRIAEVKQTGAKLIIPVDYPDAYDVDNPFDAEAVALEDMKHWELAPTNPAMLEKNGIEFAFTASGLSSAKELLPNIRKAIEYGLSEAAALKALTSTPANMVNAGSMVGTLSSGKIANFIITSKPLFDEKTSILENWVQGNRYKFKTLESPDLAGKYDLTVGNESFNLEISGEPGSQKGQIVVNDSTKVKVTSKFEEELIDLMFSPQDTEGVIRLSGWYTENGAQGKGQLINGKWVTWTAKRTGDVDSKEKKANSKDSSTLPALGSIIYPFVGHGNVQKPTQETVLIKNATLWTNEEMGIVEDTDILLQNGKIAEIGKDLSANGARVIDAAGKHVTSGIIDEHSHIAASSINDRATNSSMVRIGDVVDSEDGHIYTSLSGGVTAVQILHGSANPIGGQSALIKMRWGAAPEELKIKGADGYIKFALGENVKRSRSSNSIRFPQTRMGVEQVYVDAFTNAQQYKKEWDAFNSLSSREKRTATAPRRDLAMDAMVEIMEGDRFISCHSYVQSEINMLMKVAERFGFRVNTFTHILEGYKVADKMAEHGAGGSTFSDWWAYKWEVRYAIPYNAAIMHNAGVTVAINSDDSEMGRRLNQEAAKSVKYGGMSQEDAWKMVTLNPAKLLHLDDRMGSLKVGKDADVVIWTENPLSIYANVESTFVDGIEYYNVDKDAKMTEMITEERARLIQKMKAEKKDGAKTQKGKWQRREMFHCDDLTIDLNALND